MNREDDQQLWDLLGKTAEPQVSPFFARNVLREIRRNQTAPSAWFARFWFRKIAPIGGAVAALVVAAAVVHGPGKSAGDRKSPVVANVDLDDSDISADVDDLVGGDDDNVADDSAIL